MKPLKYDRVFEKLGIKTNHNESKSWPGSLNIDIDELLLENTDIEELKKENRFSRLDDIMKK